MADAQNNILQQLEAVMMGGSEDETRKFVIEHLNQFPLEAQRMLAVQIFSEALEERTRALKNLLELKKGLAEAIESADVDKNKG